MWEFAQSFNHPNIVHVVHIVHNSVITVNVFTLTFLVMFCHLSAIILMFPLHRMWYWCVLSGTWTCQSLCLRMSPCSSGSSQTYSLGWTVLVFAIPTSMMLWNRSFKRRNTSYCLTRCLIWVLDLILWDTGCPAQPEDYCVFCCCCGSSFSIWVFGCWNTLFFMFTAIPGG